jgi:glycosyltransferase A (GT-A) superfamily protein (DUF2064 family)
VVVGTDAPDADRELAKEAFQRLEAADLVQGPAAADGGCPDGPLGGPDLHALHGPPRDQERQPGRAGELGLSQSILPLLSDVDRLEDWIEMQQRSSETGERP